VTQVLSNIVSISQRAAGGKTAPYLSGKLYIWHQSLTLQHYYNMAKPRPILGLHNVVHLKKNCNVIKLHTVLPHSYIKSLIYTENKVRNRKKGNPTLYEIFLQLYHNVFRYSQNNRI